MRIAVAELSKPQGSWHLSQFAVAALTRVSGEPDDAVEPEAGLSGSADAVLWEANHKGDPGAYARRGIPVALVVLSSEPPGPPVSARIDFGPQPDHLRVNPHDFNAGSLTIANWLRSVLRLDISVSERRMLEVVIAGVRKVLDDEDSPVDQETKAQVQAAADTLDAQLRAPRPSRRIVSWALSQMATFPAGLITGVAATYLVDLINHFAS